MKWMMERDALIAQTKAFIESVASRSADTAKLGTGPVRNDPPPPPSEPPTSPAPSVRASEAAPKLDSAALARPLDQVSMTAEIRSRIAAFRAHQERFNRERHEYFNATLARLRASIDELPPPAHGRIGTSGTGRRPDAAPPVSSRPAAAGPSSAARRPPDGTRERT
jgi:hypothetical protein